MSWEKLRFSFWDGEQMIASLIEKWRPKGCKVEKDYERSLYDFLHNNLEDLQITKQFARARIRADLAVEDKIIIELKNNLDNTSKYHRLIGQLSDYEEWGGPVFLVLCGKTEPNLLKEVRKQIEKRNGTLAHSINFSLFQK